jgi:Mg2+/Co2+ transporter CorC
LCRPLTGGIFALVTSVLSLILFSEILPQSICSRHALEIGAHMIQFVKLLRILLYPVAAPIAYLLDLMLGQELGTIYDRDGLKGLIDVHARSKYGVLTEDETEIMKGTLDFSLKTVEDAMTRAEDVYMLDVDSTLNRKTVNEMLTRGHSRIPLYEHDRNNVVCLLLLKQLVFVDVDDNLPIRALINKKKRNRKVRVAPALYCLPGAKLSEVLREFQRGRSHMAIVFDKMAGPNEAGTLLGIVTMEDLIEELIGNINDETDVYISNESKDPVLVRGADGKLKRVTHTRTRLPGTSTVVLKEIDVDRLKQPLIASLRGQKLVPDWRRPVRYGSVSHAKSMPLDAADGGAPSALRRPRVAEGLPPSDNASDDPEAGVDAEDVADLESQELRRLRHRQLSLPDPDAIVPSVAEAVEPGSRASVRGTSVRWKEWTSGDPNSPSGEGITCAPPPARSESRKYGADGGLRPMHLSLDISKFPETVQSDDET